jgi:hypothetical protein
MAEDCNEVVEGKHCSFHSKLVSALRKGGALS